MNRLGLEYITLLGVSPLHFIRTAAEVGCRHVSLIPEQIKFGDHSYLDYSLIDNPTLRRDIVACLDDNDVSIALVDGFAVFPDGVAEDYRRAFNMLAELGVTRINTVSFDNWARTVEETGKIVSMAAEYSVTVTVEACPPLTVKNLGQALDLISAVNLPNFKLLIDTMHVARAGDVDALAKVEPSLIDYVQISDAPLRQRTDDEYMDEAMNERMIPGQGEIPLVEMLRNIPDHVVVSAEVPLRSLRQAGVSDLERARLVVDGTRKVLSAL